MLLVRMLSVFYGGAERTNLRVEKIPYLVPVDVDKKNNVNREIQHQRGLHQEVVIFARRSRNIFKLFWVDGRRSQKITCRSSKQSVWSGRRSQSMWEKHVNDAHHLVA